jgi:hypothetical protein
MKVLSIGDTHGNFVLDDVIKLLPQYDKIIFVGDYVDSFELTNLTIITNLNLLIQLKKDNPDKIVLLWGNHDLHYLYDDLLHRCSGYRVEAKPNLYKIFNDNKKLFTCAYQIDNYLWTHAGVHTGWYKQRFAKFVKANYLEDLSIATQLNCAFEQNEKSLFDVGHGRGGYYDVGGPLWCDRRELLGNPLRKYHQIVGHSRVEDYYTVYSHNDTSVTFIDIIEQHIDTFGCLKENSFYSKEI